MFLAILFFVAAIFCFCIPFVLDKSSWFDRCLTISIICIVVSFISGCIACDDGPSKWDKLTKEEKEWYKNNYGNGQYDDYKGAIDDYYN